MSDEEYPISDEMFDFLESWYIIAGRQIIVKVRLNLPSGYLEASFPYPDSDRASEDRAEAREAKREEMSRLGDPEKV